MPQPVILKKLKLTTPESGSSLEGMAQDFNTKEMTILFVGSDKQEQDSFRYEFDPYFKLIITENNGAEALKLLEATDVDLVVSDVETEGMDGFELCRKIKSTLEISHIPVILLTSRSDKRNKSLGYKLGADAFIPDRHDFKQMYSLIRSQLGGRFEIKRQYNFGFFDKMNLDQTFSVTDEEFIGSLNTLIDQFISDPSFNKYSIIEQTGISHSVILKKMQGLLGTSLTTYLARIRISVVKEKLKNSDEELEAIAKETGFLNTDDMKKAFKRETGKDIESVRGQ